jgi:hypothetical protein
VRFINSKWVLEKVEGELQIPSDLDSSIFSTPPFPMVKLASNLLSGLKRIKL